VDDGMVVPMSIGNRSEGRVGLGACDEGFRV